MDILSHFISATEKAIFAVSNGCDPKEEILALKPLQAELRLAFDMLVLRPDPIAAAAERSRKALEARNTEMFSLSWRSGGEPEYIEGWKALAKRLDLSENTIYQYFLKHGGTFYLTRFNPTSESQEKDSLQVSRLLRSGEPMRRKRGRPRKHRPVEFM